MTGSDDPRIEHPSPCDASDCRLGAPVRMDEPRIPREDVVGGEVVIVPDRAVALDLLHEDIADLGDLRRR